MPISVKILANIATINPSSYKEGHWYKLEFITDNFLYDYGTRFAKPLCSNIKLPVRSKSC